MGTPTLLRIATLLCLALCLAPLREASANELPAALYIKKCGSCHTFGKGDLIGPDLKGVTRRRDRRWLTAWIQSSEKMIRSGDPVAVSLFRKYKQERMPDQNLSTDQIAALLDYLEADGPYADAHTRTRHAITATTAEMQTGEDLFLGRVALTNGSASCISCHSIDGAATGGTLACDLTHVYSKFQDNALSSFLPRSYYSPVPNFERTNVLTEQESFALKAFLRHADSRQRASSAAAAAIVSDDDHPSSPSAPSESRRDRLLFGVMPYFAVLCLVSILPSRYLLARRHRARLCAELSRASEMFSRSAACWCALALVLFGHLLALLSPQRVLLWNRAWPRLVILESTLLAIGAIAFWGLICILKRRLVAAPDHSDGSFTDGVVLTLLFIAVASGLAVSVRYRWASSWSAVTLAPYLRSVSMGRPSIELIADMPLLVRLHVFTAFAIAAAVPFTSVAYWLVLPLHRVLDLVGPLMSTVCRAAWNTVAGWEERSANAISTWLDDEE